MSMRIERSSLDQVKKRFETIKKKQEEKKKEYDFEERMRELREEVCTEKSLFTCCHIRTLRKKKKRNDCLNCNINLSS